MFGFGAGKKSARGQEGRHEKACGGGAERLFGVLPDTNVRYNWATGVDSSDHHRYRPALIREPKLFVLEDVS